jgi:hypothetical protein
MIAALYVDPRGVYSRMPGVDPWDASRDAREYPGTDPVVAHPPCGPWGRLKHEYRGDEHDCALRAVTQVRAWGGVLEHPAHSALWRTALLPLPGELPDALGGYTTEVSQVDWGHVARKKTWLYLVGVPRDLSAIRPPPREPTHWVSGYRASATRKSKGGGGTVPPGIKVCSAAQRRRTPLAFAEWLVTLAESARGSNDD